MATTLWSGKPAAPPEHAPGIGWSKSTKPAKSSVAMVSAGFGGWDVPVPEWSEPVKQKACGGKPDGQVRCTVLSCWKVALYDVVVSAAEGSAVLIAAIRATVHATTSRRCMRNRPSAWEHVPAAWPAGSRHPQFQCHAS